MMKNDSSKNKKVSPVMGVETGRGVIKDNFLAALVTSPMYKTQIVKAKKGKGSYQRKNKHKGQEPYLMAA